MADATIRFIPDRFIFISAWMTACLQRYDAAAHHDIVRGVSPAPKLVQSPCTLA